MEYIGQESQKALLKCSDGSARPHPNSFSDFSLLLTQVLGFRINGSYESKILGFRICGRIRNPEGAGFRAKRTLGSLSFGLGNRISAARFAAVMLNE